MNSQIICNEFLASQRHLVGQCPTCPYGKIAPALEQVTRYTTRYNFVLLIKIARNPSSHSCQLTTLAKPYARYMPTYQRKSLS